MFEHHACRAVRLISGLSLLFLSCATNRAGTSPTPIDEAKRVVQSHERNARAGDLDAIMSNATDDVVVLAPNTPLIQGKAALREFYASLLKAGAFDFGHDYAGAAVVADTVFLHGVARGTFTPTGAQPNRFANNFILVLRRDAGGKYKFWRISFGPSQP
jgi:ketosteroid isomerase-like protein